MFDDIQQIYIVKALLKRNRKFRKDCEGIDLECILKGAKSLILVNKVENTLGSIIESVDFIRDLKSIETSIEEEFLGEIVLNILASEVRENSSIILLKYKVLLDVQKVQDECMSYQELYEDLALEQ